MRKLPLDRKHGAARHQADGQILRPRDQGDGIMRKLVDGDGQKSKKIIFYAAKQRVTKDGDEKERVNFDFQKKTGRLAETLGSKTERKIAEAIE